MRTRKAAPEKYKLTIRLSANVLKRAKIWAAAYEENLQDFVERALWEATRDPNDLAQALLVKAAKQKAKREAK